MAVDPCEAPLRFSTTTAAQTFEYQPIRPSQLESAFIHAGRCNFYFHGCTGTEVVSLTFDNFNTGGQQGFFSVYENFGSSLLDDESVLLERYPKSNLLANLQKGKVKTFPRASDFAIKTPHGQSFVSFPTGVPVVSGSSHALLTLTSIDQDVGFTVQYSCVEPTSGCMDSAATNFNRLVSFDDSSCTYSPSVPQSCAVNHCEAGYTCTANPRSSDDECSCVVSSIHRPAGGSGDDPFAAEVSRLTTGSCAAGATAESFLLAVNAAAQGVYWLRFRNTTAFGSTMLLADNVSVVIEGQGVASSSSALVESAALPELNIVPFNCRNMARCLFRRLAMRNKVSMGNAGIGKVFDTATLVLHHVELSGAIAFSFHGALWCHTGAVCDLLHVRATDNYANENAAVGGWGAFRILSSEFANNAALRGSATMFNRGRQAGACSVASDCFADGFRPWTGAWDCVGGSCEPQVEITSSSFTNNLAFGDRGGAIIVGQAGFPAAVSLTLDRLQNNIAAVAGSAAYWTGVKGPMDRAFEIVDSEISQTGNHDDAVSQVHVFGSHAWLLHSSRVMADGQWKSALLHSADSSIGGCSADHEPTPPCAHGYECVDKNNSAWCHACASDLVGLDGRVCQSCVWPEVPNEQNTGCIRCPPGNFNEGGVCTSCARGRYIDNSHDSCVYCDPGQQPGTNRSACVFCPAGTFSNVEADEGSFGLCTNCIEGEIPVDNQATCDHCLEIGATSVAGAANCTHCEEGYYGYWAKEEECFSCLDVVIPPGLPNGEAAMRKELEKACPGGARGVDAVISPLSGAWIYIPEDRSAPVTLIACENAVACSNFENMKHGSPRQAWLEATNTSSTVQERILGWGGLCHEDYAGALCKDCAPEHVKIDGHCRVCTGFNMKVFLQFLVTNIAIGLLLLHLNTTPVIQRQQVEDIWNKVDVHVRIDPQISY